MKYYSNKGPRGFNYDGNRDYNTKQEYRYKSPYSGRSRARSSESVEFNRGRFFFEGRSKKKYRVETDPFQRKGIPLKL